MGASLVLRCVTFLSLLSHALAQKGNYPLMYGDGSILKGATQACIDTFNSNVTCTQAIGSLYTDPYPRFKETVLDGLCTATCFNSLVSLRSSLISNCGTRVTYLDVADGSNWPVTYLADLAIFNYNMTCLPRSDGQYCNSWFQTGVDATPKPDCDECYLKTAYMQAESSIKGDAEDMKEMYASMTSSCGYNGPPATKTASAVVISSPTATSDCTLMYTIKPGDTAISVSVSQKMNTQDLITANGLSYTLEKFPAAGTLCIRNQCKIHTIRSDDTCQRVLASEDISQAKLLSWNPFINGHCDNIANFVNQTLCLSNPLGDFSVEDNKDSSFYTEPAPVPANIAPDTTTNCGVYYNTTIGDDCGKVTMKFSISLDDFIFLNPMIWQNCTNLWSDTSYCAAPVGRITEYPGYGNPEPVFSITPDVTKAREYFNPFAEDGDSVYIPLANNTRNDCWDYMWWNTSLGVPITCWELADSSGITREQFILWNPSLDQKIDDTDATKSYDYDCTIAPSVSYCSALASPTPMVAATPVPASPRAMGEIEGCTKWFRSALSCESHLSMLRISLADFYRFNPSISADCSSYVLGTYYCYSTNDEDSPPIDPSTTNTSPNPSTTSDASATPKPIQDGMVSGCTSFYLVVGGDGCWAIANDNGISLDDLYAWNPALKGDCTGLYPTYYVCISRNPISTSAPGATSTRPVTSSTTRAQISSTASRTSTANPVATPSSPPISGDATCGGLGGNTCLGSTFGNCCSSSGWCGDTAAYCGSGCQGAFGSCNTAPEKISPDGSCGGPTGDYTCVGSEFGPCCSQYGWCGSTVDHCTNCQVGFGC